MEPFLLYRNESTLKINRYFNTDNKLHNWHEMPQIDGKVFVLRRL